ncbi:Lateral organ boundaries domain containing protein [Trema orientale]|uniref:Lateral organ boundaries domain containing protein n=1 Tax=Trema orientale TaxID=63057 RepID=A0A2P5EYF3_TREOI|nr:Lateral organ boundaries domain containing protein [Trema orientale]
MSCNGCRVLRKGCSDNCMLKECLQWIESPQAQAHATLFVAKFFGRAGLMSFISAVPQHQRPALFQSLLYEAVGRTVNPVNGAVGLLWTGNWHVCQSAVETVLRGGALGPLSEAADQTSADNAGSDIDHLVSRRSKKRPITNFDDHGAFSPSDLDLCLMAGRRSSSSTKMVEKIRAATPSEESETTTLASSSVDSNGARSKLLRLFM